MKKRYGFSTSLLTIGLITANVSWAQADMPAPQSDAAANTPEDSGGSTDIVVTARKRSERLLDVPLSVSAATGDQLAARGVTDVAQLEKVSPGFTYQQSWYGSPVYSIRGIGFFDNAVSSSPTVTTYVDQVPLPYSAMARGIALDVERVEVLKGPQGTLFGQNSTGGAANFIAAKPTKDVAAGFDLDLGRFETVNAQAFVSGPLAPTLNARLAVRSESRNDWQKGYAPNDSRFGKAPGDELGDRRFQTARLLLAWDPSDKVSFVLGANGWRDKSDTIAPRFMEFRPTAALNPFNGATYAALTGLPALPKNNRLAGWDADKDFAHDDYFYQFSLNGTLELSDTLNLISISAYSRYHENSLTEVDGTAFVVGDTRIMADVRSYYQELRLAGEAGRLNWMLGANYARDESNEIQRSTLRGGTNAGVGPFRYTGNEVRNRQDVDTLSGFASADYKITDSLNLHGSIRYTDQNRSYAGCLADPGNGTLAAAFNFGFGINAVPGGLPDHGEPRRPAADRRG